jgi:hypothetical protein
MVLLAALSVIAFFLTLRAGQRGLYPFDQCILFDGSYRVLSGQVPYRDFIIPFGPVAFWLHALFFKVLGVSYFAYLAGAGVINALAALSAVMVVRWTLPSSRALSYVAGVLTAVWFYPPFGTPWVDQTAFFFSLLGLGVFVVAVGEKTRSTLRNPLLALCGCLAFVSFISKQNVGAFMFFVYPLVLFMIDLPGRRRRARSLGLFAAGFVATLAAFAVWLYVASDFATFVEYFLRVPSALGSERLSAFARSWFGLLRPFFGGRGPLAVNIMIWASLVVAVVTLVKAAVRHRGERRHERWPLVVSTICIYCILFQHLFINTTLNQPENGLGFLGIIFALAMGLLLHMAGITGGMGAPGRTRRVVRVVLVVGIIVGVVFGSVSAIGVAMDRKVHDILRGSEYPGHLAVEGLTSLKWAQPTRMGGFEISEDSIIRLHTYLKGRGQNFFVFPDFTLFYGLCGVPSPQPVLWFHKGVTYAQGANSRLDERIVAELERNDVTVLVLEQVSWFNTGERLGHFPRMKSYLMKNFTKAGQIGTFSVYETVPGQD